MFPPDGIFRCEAGQNEILLRVVDEELLRSAPWLRESRFRKLPASRKRSGWRVAAYTRVERGKRHSYEPPRIWFLREGDRFDLPCPVEAVVPSSIAMNGQSEPFFRSEGDRSGKGIAHPKALFLAV